MDFVTVQRAYQDRSIYEADLPTLRSYLHVVNQHPPHIDPRYRQIAATIQSLIDERQNQTRHQLLTQQAKDLHQEAQGEISKVSKELSKVRDGVIEIKDTLQRTHRIHSRILTVAVVTGVLALIAALDVILKWFSK